MTFSAFTDKRNIDISRQTNLSSAPPWMVYYVSMVILLTTFFVIYMTRLPKSVDLKVPQMKQKEDVESFEKEVEESGGVLEIKTGKDISKLVKALGESKSRNFVELITLLRSAFVDDLGVDKPSIAFYFDVIKQDMIITLGGTLFFKEGEVKLSDSAKEKLEKISEVIRSVPYMVSIQAFTDKKPIRTKKFPSNWELSSERAMNILRFFFSEGLEGGRFVGEGFGEFAELDKRKNIDNEDRKVEIVFMDITPD